MGDWLVEPSTGKMSNGGATVHVDERAMRLLVALARRPGEVVAIEDLLGQVWPEVIVTPDSVYQAIASLRRSLGDDARRPTYIATVPRLGYKLVAAVGPGAEPAEAPRRVFRARRGAVLAAALGVLGLVAVWALGPRPPAMPAPTTPVSVGVAPFVDLTPSMDQDRLADEMTEGLADKLSATPSLKSPGFRSSFYLIGKHVSLSAAAQALGVDFVVDGGTRRDGNRVRISARLAEPRTGRLLWSATYTEAVTNLAPAQGAIAAAVSARLAAGGPRPGAPD